MAEREPASPEDLERLREAVRTREVPPDEQRRYRDEKEAWHIQGCLPDPTPRVELERFLDNLSALTFPPGAEGRLRKIIQLENIKRAFDVGLLPAWVRNKAEIILAIKGNQAPETPNMAAPDTQVSEKN